MPNLYEILQKKQLKKFPPLPDWVKQTLKALETDTDAYDYFEFTHSIRFDPKTKQWTMTTDQ
jgi:hypothetical protein